MRHHSLTALLIGTTVILSACGQTDVTRAVNSATAAEADSIREIMLSAAAPDEAIRFFQAKSDEEPEDIAHTRGLATSLARGGRHAEAVLVWRRVVAHEAAQFDDSVELTGALIRTSDWDGAKAVLNTIPPSHQTFDRYRMEAVVADSARQWDKADSFYETASGLTTKPAGVLNNWGYSKLSRGDAAAAEKLFTEAITYDSSLFTAKNNLVLARASRRVYTLPIIRMNSEEKAQLLHTAGLAAIKQGDVDIGRSLLEDAIDAHPSHFEPAVSALRGLDA